MTALPSFETLILRREGARLDVLFNRPEQRNAINSGMSREFSELVDFLAGTPAIRVVTVRGAGGHFCAGGDIKERRAMAGDTGGVEAIEKRNRDAGHMFLRFARLPQTTISLIEGSAFGGGFGYACLTDITILTRGARMGMPETQIGVAPAQIARWVVQRVGLPRARQLALTAERFDGETAYGYGVGQYLCDDEEADQMLESVVAKVQSCGPLACAATKRIMVAVDEGRETELIDLAAREFGQLNGGSEAREGQSAFAEKRTPVWGAAQ
ncbi:MAG: enoyl-CoA hydratase-related protein [Ottowia sp.]|uniref:enoyl-CoA hydratase/isomerase family protein n=1 Tax=Ottowia sp. TaxID=1898956 RepID=UPI003C7485DA